MALMIRCLKLHIPCRNTALSISKLFLETFGSTCWSVSTYKIDINDCVAKYRNNTNIYINFICRHRPTDCVAKYRIPPLDNIRVMVIVWRLRGNIIRTAPCWVV